MPVQSGKVRVGLIGFGEVGSSLGLGLKKQGVEVVAFDKGFQTPPFGELIQKRAREAGVPLLDSVESVVSASDLILSMVPGGFAMEAARAAVPALTCLLYTSDAADDLLC